MVCRLLYWPLHTRGMRRFFRSDEKRDATMKIKTEIKAGAFVWND